MIMLLYAEKYTKTMQVKICKNLLIMQKYAVAL